MNPAEYMEEATELFIDRNNEYSSGYLLHGEVMANLFPKGVTLSTPTDFAQYSHINIMVAKIQRMATALTRGINHIDSAKDIMVYAGMYLEAGESRIIDTPLPPRPNPAPNQIYGDEGMHMRRKNCEND